MKATQVDQALHQKFVVDGARVVFWHDPNREFVEYVADGLTESLSEVQVLRVVEVGGLTATVPFDDRMHQGAALGNLSQRLMVDFLEEIGSELAELPPELSVEVLGRQMKVVRGAQEAPLPVNVGLLFFNSEPRDFFPATQIDVVYFPEGEGGDRFEEKEFSGPLGRVLKELDLCEGRSTGVRKILKAMAANGSPGPVFETDEDRSYFLIRLPVHERAREMPAEVQAPGEVTGEVTGEVQRLLEALEGEMSRRELQQALGLKHQDHFRDAYLVPALDGGFVEMTVPEKPRSSKQRYRLTAAGRHKNSVGGQS